MKHKENEFLKEYSSLSLEEIQEKFNICGLSTEEVLLSRNKNGKNESDTKKDGFLIRIKRAFINPYSLVLLILGIISLFTDIIFASKKTYTTIIIVFSMLILAATIRLIEELKAKKVADKLNKFTDFKVKVKRNNEETLIDSKDLVVGDIISLKAGDKVPCDIRILKANGVFVSESSITGESKIILKSATSSTNLENILFNGTSVTAGSLEGVAIAVGKNTFYGNTSYSQEKRGYDRVANSVILVLIKFMIVLLPLIFVTVGLLKDNWIEALLFSLSVAVGLTPELLPMVITACLAKGSASMRDKKTIVKNINAMQSFGAMDVICVDKTGTLTEDRLKLEYFMDVLGNESTKVLDYAYLNSYFASGIENHIDNAILEVGEVPNLRDKFKKLRFSTKKLDEMPFDYEAGMSEILLKYQGENILIVKGKIEEILGRTTKIEYKNKEIAISESMKNDVHQIVDEMLNDGLKVLAIAYQKSSELSIKNINTNDLVLLGFLAFFDPPKKTAKEAIQKLADLNIRVKLLTGDDSIVSKTICRRLNINYSNSLTGQEFMELDEDGRRIACENIDVFTELSPKDKEYIVNILINNGHTVGFLGDGLNDVRAMRKSNVGISVDTAPKVLKDASDVILLKKDLKVLEGGILEGRKAFTNMNKYIKISASSNLGNILAIIIASIFLPFLPITALQILLLNLLYDVTCLVLPWDNIDDDYYKKPSWWSGSSLTRFMLFFGPISTIFDIITFSFLYFYLCPTLTGGAFLSLDIEKQTMFISLFQTGWFLESMWTQILIIHLLRTKSLSLINGKPSKYVIAITILGIILFTSLVMTPLGELVGLIELPLSYFLFLLLIILGYFITITIFKNFYIKKYNNLI